MTEFSIKTQLKLLTAYNVGEVLDVILHSLAEPGQKVNEVILLLSRYRDLNRDAGVGRIDRDETTTEMKRIRWSIMAFLDDASAQELHFERAAQLLQTDNRLQHIVEPRSEKITFRGMLGTEEEIIIETLAFKWQEHFLPQGSQQLHHTEQLIAALQLLQGKYLEPTTDWANLEGEALLGSLYQAARELREIPKVKTYAWEHVLTPPPQRFSDDSMSVVGYVHETIEVLMC